MTYTNFNEHVSFLLSRLVNRITVKYIAGQREHGGRLWKKPVLKMLGDEITDLNTYYDVLAEQHELALSLLDEALTDDHSGRHNSAWSAILSARNVLRYGNEEGQDEPDA